MCTNPIIGFRLKESFWSLPDLVKWKFNHVLFQNSHGYCLNHISFAEKFITKNKKHKVFFNLASIPAELHEYFEPLLLPCGKCDACLLKRASDWSLRCQHEALYHKDIMFLTLTYDNEHLPTNNGVPTVFYPDIQYFLKRLRADLKYKYGKKAPKIRYFLCQEYGGKTKRPHFHVILFGYHTHEDELKNSHGTFINYWKRGKSGLKTYRSPILESYWRKGFVVFGERSSKYSYGYVARYTLDKSKNKHTKGFYRYRFPEKIGMSRRDAIGSQWLKENYKEILIQGYIRDLQNLKTKHSIPRSYLQLVEKFDSKFYWNEFYNERQKQIVKYHDVLLQNIKCPNDFIKIRKHQIDFNKNLIKTKLKRTLQDEDFDEFFPLNDVKYQC